MRKVGIELLEATVKIEIRDFHKDAPKFEPGDMGQTSACRR